MKVETHCWLAMPEVGCWVTAQGRVCRLGGDLNNGLAAQFQRCKCALEVSCTWDVLYKSTSLPFLPLHSWLRDWPRQRDRQMDRQTEAKRKSNQTNQLMRVFLSFCSIHLSTHWSDIQPGVMVERTCQLKCTEGSPLFPLLAEYCLQTQTNTYDH